MSNVAITGSIIAAHKKNNQTAQQIPRQYNPNGFQVPLPSQNVGRIKFGGWQEDLDDVNMRLSKIHRDPNATERDKEQAELTYRNVREAERLGERRKGQTEALTTASGASFGIAMGPLGAALTGFGGFLLGKVLGDENKESSYLERLLSLTYGDLFKRGRASIIDQVVEESRPNGTHQYYDRYGKRCSVTITERQAKILRKNIYLLTKQEAKLREEVLVQLDYYGDIKKDPDYKKGTSRIGVPKRFI